nr:gustatory and odorant receptor 22-like [Halyomorpha halys]
MFWCITLYELRTASDKLLNRIIASGCRNMYQYRILWLKLSDLISTIGESIGHTGLAVCALIFTTFVFTTYGLLSLAIDHAFTKSFCGLLCTSLLSMSLQFIMCDAAHRTTQAAGEKFSSKLLELSTSSLSQKDQFEMNFLLQTMMTNPPVIHFIGYMIIDRNLFVKFISDTVTYLVVLIQFKTSSLARSLVNASSEVFN